MYRNGLLRPNKGRRTMCKGGRGRRVPRAIVGVLVAAFVGSVHAQKHDRSLTPEELIERIEQADRIVAEQKQQIEEQEKKLKEYRKALEQILAKDKLQRKALAARRGTGPGGAAGAVPAKTDSEGPAQATQGTSDEGRVVAQAQTQEPEAAPEAPAGKPPESATRPPEIAPLTELQSVLTPRGKLVLEPSLDYSYSSSDRVALVGFTIIPAITIGLIDIRRVSRNFVSPVVTARYGLTSRSELEVKVPYVFRSESTTTRPLAGTGNDEVFNADGNGIGDIELSGRYQLNQGGPTKPFFIGSLRFKTTTGKGPFDLEFDRRSGLPIELATGTGFYALQPGITALLPSDPAVFFGTLTYTWNMKESVNRLDAEGNFIGDVDPGDGVGFSFGMGLAINERASFSLGYQHDIFFKDRVDGQIPLLAQNISLGRLLVGFSYQLSKRTNFNLSLGVGVTDESPDVTVTLRLPMTF